MAKYHISAKGEPGVCNAQEGNCPLGALEEHYGSKSEAREGYEKRMAEANLVLERLARGENVLLETRSPNRQSVITLPEGFEEDPAEVDDNDYYCFVCSRPTNHFAEHDDLVGAGMVEYGKDGKVRRTEKWDDAEVKRINEKEYQKYLAKNEQG